MWVMIHYVASIYKKLGHMTHGYANNVSIKYKYEDTNDKSPIAPFWVCMKSYCKKSYL